MAEQQDWTLVQAILDYRNARTAIALVNQGGAALEKEPDLMTLLLELHRAQGVSLQRQDLVTMADAQLAAASEDQEG